MSDNGPIPEAELAERICASIRKELDAGKGEPLGEGYQATVRLVESSFGRFVVKCPHSERVLGSLAKASIVREHEIYRRLAGIEGIPRCYGLIDDEYLVLEYIDGRSYRDLQYELVDRESYFAALLETLRAMHAAGVAHGDLKRKDNLLVGPGERPYLIDFGVACVRKQRAGPVNRVWFDWVRQIDYNAWLKLKYMRQLENMTPEDRALHKPLFIERIARWLRLNWQRLTARE